jgi:twitching motility protein PilT
MQTFDQSLYFLFKNGLITLEEALRRSSNPDEFRLKIEGVQYTSDLSREEMESSLGQSHGAQGADDEALEIERL